MSDEQFVIWLRGFSSAVRTAPTIDQWEKIQEELEKICLAKEKQYPYIIPVPQPCPPWVTSITTTTENN